MAAFKFHSGDSCLLRLSPTDGPQRSLFDEGCLSMNPLPKPTSNGSLRSGHIGLLQVVGQCFSIGPLMDVALFLGIVASMAGAVGPLAVLLAALPQICAA
jgi:hypothetical protein